MRIRGLALILRFMDRITAITLCMDRLEDLRNCYSMRKPFVDRWNNLWGELDWLDELHNLIWSESNVNES